MNNVNHKMIGDGFKEVNEILKRLEERFDWYCVRSSWEAGYIVLAGILGGPCDEILEEDNDFGIIFLTREYVLGDWEDNCWDLEIIPDTSFCCEEVKLLGLLMEELNGCKEKYSSSEEETDSYADRQVVEEIIEKERTCIRQSKGREKDSVKL